MPYRPRELVVRAREAAALLLSALDHQEMVRRFLDLYAAEHRRPGRADYPSQYYEQVVRIRRESILTMALRIETALPVRLKVSFTVRAARQTNKTRKGKKRRGAAPPKKKVGIELAIPFLDLFREEFLSALGQSLEWDSEDAGEFWRDLALYERLAARQPRRMAGQGARPASSGPFVDRVAMLLDPSLMEQARRAAGKFEAELWVAADAVLRKVFSPRRTN